MRRRTIFLNVIYPATSHWNSSKKEEDCDAKTISLKVQELTTGFHGTRLKATFPELVQEMIQRHKDCNRNFGDSAFVMCSFDGAIHGNSNVVSFSTQILSHIMNKKEATTTTTDNILTWQQIECPEKVYAILEAVWRIISRRNKWQGKQSK